MIKKDLGIAMGCGAWRGLAHIGILKGLEKNNIQPEYVCGCSVGSLVGGLYSYFGNTVEIEKILENMNYKDLIGAIMGNPIKSKILKEEESALEKFLKKIVGNTKIEDLKIKFSCVAVDVHSGKLVEINSGSLAKAIRASTAIPVIFDPVKIGRHCLVDGGAIMPVPVEIARRMGAKKVMGVSLYGGIFPIPEKTRVSKMMMAKLVRFFPLKTLADINLIDADYVVIPKIPNDDLGLFGKFLGNKETIDAGEMAVQEIISSL